jgi:hypothetical protein
VIRLCTSVTLADPGKLGAGEGRLRRIGDWGLESHHAERNHHRRYEATIGLDLFGDWTVTIRYERNLFALIPRHSGQTSSLAEGAMVPANRARPSVLSCPTPRSSLSTCLSPVSVVSTSPGLPRGVQPVSPARVGSRVLHEA